MGKNTSTVSEDGLDELEKKLEDSQYLLPKDMLFQIFLFLEMKDLANFFTLSKIYNRLLSDDVIWKLLLKRDHVTEYSKDIISPRELYRLSSSKSGYIHHCFGKNRKDNEEAYEEVGWEFGGEHWSNCMACDGCVAAFSFERHGMYFIAFDCQTGKQIASDGDGVSQGIKGHCVAINDGILYVGVNVGIRLYKINEGFELWKVFGGNTAKLPPRQRRMTEEQVMERERLVNGHTAMISHIEFSEDYIVTGCSGGRIYTWKKDTHDLVGSCLLNSGYIECMDVHGDFLAVASHTKVRLFDLTTREEFASLDNDFDKFCFCAGCLFVFKDEEFSLYEVLLAKKNKKAELKLKKKRRVNGYNFCSRIVTDCNKSVFGSGTIIPLVVKKNSKTVNQIRVYDVKSKSFQDGDWEEENELLLSLDVDVEKYKATEHEGITMAAIHGKYLYMGVGRFNFVRFKITGM